MICRFHFLLTTIFVLQLFGQQLLAQNVPGGFAAGEQLVILKNGSVVQGFVERTATELSIQTAQGSRLIIANEQTDFVCDSLEQAYWGKLARIRATDVEGQIQLFNWCLQHDLLSYGQNQIDILFASNIKATRLEYLNRQLEIEIMQKRKLRERAALAKVESHSQKSPSPLLAGNLEAIASANETGTEPGTAFFDQVTPEFRPLPSLNESLAGSNPPGDRPVIFKSIRSPVEAERSEILQVGFENPVPIPSPLSNAGRGDAMSPNEPATIAELEKMTRSMPRNSLGVFRQQVENVVVSRCSRCHDADSTVMPLMHAGKSRPITRRMSQRNLHSMLGFVDLQTPVDSRLLSAASTAHGGSETPGIALDSDQYNNMRDWIIMISDRPGQSVVPLEPPPDDAIAIDLQSIKPLKGSVASEPELNYSVHSGLGIPSVIGEIPQLNTRSPHFTPRDDFDPEIFNRKYVDRID